MKTKKLLLLFVPMIMLALIPAFNSCEKDDPTDPIQQKIEELTALSKTQATALRAAVEPATKGFGGQYWEVFNNKNVPSAINLLDSATVHIRVIDEFHYIYGNPLPEPPTDNAAVNDLYTKANTYRVTMAELNKLLER